MRLSRTGGHLHHHIPMKLPLLKEAEPHLLLVITKSVVWVSTDSIFGIGGGQVVDGFTGATMLGPVSYTHLDVYKRQANHPSLEHRRPVMVPGRQTVDSVQTHIVYQHTGLLVCRSPDVYKRQR